MERGRRIRRGRARVGIALLLVLLMGSLLSAVSRADTTMPDGDGDLPVSSAINPLNFGTVCVGTTYVDNVLVAIMRNDAANDGQRTFANGATVTVGFQATPDNSPHITEAMTDTTIKLPSNWLSQTTGTMSTSPTIATSNPSAAFNVTLTATAADTSATVNVSASGLNAGTTATITRNTGLKVLWTPVTGCPSVTINQAAGQGDPTSTPTINFTAEFSANVTGFTASDVVLSGTAAGGTTATVTGGPAIYNVAVTGMTVSGTVVATIPAGAAVASGKPNTPSTSTDNTVTFVADAVAPSVTINEAAGQNDPTNDTEIDFAVLFDEDVTGFDGTDVDLTSSTVGGTLTATVTGGPATYNVAVSGMTTTGTVVARIPAAAAKDGANNNSQASTSVDNVVTYDNIDPNVTIDQKAGQADPTNTSPIRFTVTFDEDVTGFDETDVDLTSSTVGGTLTATVTGTGADYEVAVGGMTTPGNVVARIGPDEASDAAGNGNTTSTSTDNTVAWDATAPVVDITTATPSPVDPQHTSTTVTWKADEGGTTYTVRVGGASCADGASVASGSYPTADAVTTTSVSAASLAYGDNTIRVCVTDPAGNTGSDTENVIKRAPTTLTFNSDPPVAITGTSTTVAMKATLTDTTTPCVVSGQTIVYTIDTDGDGVFTDETAYGSTSTVGTSNTAQSSLNRSFTPGIWLVRVDFAGSTYCAPSSDSDGIVAVVNADDAANGGGWYQIASVTGASKSVNFGFTTRWDTRAGAYRGQILVHNKQAWRLKGDVTGFVKKSTTPVSGELTGNAALFCWDTGLADWKLADGAVTFKAQFEDTGVPNKKTGAVKPDTFTIQSVGAYTPSNGCPATVSPLVQATKQALKGGNVHIK